MQRKRKKNVPRARDATSPSPSHHLCPCRLSRVRVVISIVAVGAVGAGARGIGGGGGLVRQW